MKKTKEGLVLSFPKDEEFMRGWEGPWKKERKGMLSSEEGKTA